MWRPHDDRAGARGARRTGVTILTTLISVSAAILSAGLLIASSAPFDNAFARQHGAHLTAQFDGARVTAEQLSATAHVARVTAAAGPYPTVTAQVRAGTNNELIPTGLDLGPITIVGRPSAGGLVDDLTLVAGHWPTGPGQLVASTDARFPAGLGDRVQFAELPGQPTMEIVGVGQSIGATADAWATPAGVTAVTAPGTAPGFQMLYRFTAAATDAQIATDRAAVTAAVPAGALTGSQSYLATRQLAVTNTAAFVPFLVAFGVLGIVLSVLIIGVVVGGAVGAATRRIGVLKALGFTPGQVVRAYIGQALIPAAIGVGVGIVLGNVLAIPVLHGADAVYGASAVSIPAWLDVAVPGATLMAVGVVALVPALAAGRLRVAEATAVGRTRASVRGRGVARLAGRLALPRPLGLGLARPIARPGRSAATALAVLFGALTLTFALGLILSLTAIQTGRNPDSSGSVVVDTGGPSDAPPGAIAVHAAGPGKGGGEVTRHADPTAVAAAIRAQQGTRSVYGTTDNRLTVSGIAGTTNVIGYQGDSTWATHQMVSGRWLTGPGQAVVSTRFLTAAGRSVGDTLTVSDHGRVVSLRIVGEVFELSSQGMDLFTSTTTFGDLGLDAAPGRFNVELAPGTDVQQYLGSLQSALRPLGADAMPNPARTSDVIKAMDALVGTFTLLLVVVAGLGVFNTVLLDTRERAHDLGVFKALGMTPRQTVAMVLTSVGLIGLLAGAVGVPAGIALHHLVMPMMGHVAGTTLPGVDVAVYSGPIVVVLLLGGLLIAMAGALAPAGWAAGTRTTTALRTE
jgi:putative ABC transport system permease protein